VYERNACPPSATHGATAALGFIAFLLSVAIIAVRRPYGDDVVSSSLFIAFVTALGVFTLDIVWWKVDLRPSTGLRFDEAHASLERTLYKFCGLLGSVGFIALLYWLFPEYHASFYEHYYHMLKIVLPPCVLLALPYFYLLDRHMTQPYDGYWHTGKLMTLQWREADRAIVRQHLLGWIVKGFFLPLMFTYMCDDVKEVFTYTALRLTDFQSWFGFLNRSLYFIDVSFATMGYMAALRITDTHLRSVEPSVLGWGAALVCYQPFWSLAGSQYLAYETNYQWDDWLSKGSILYDIWACIILALAAMYVWATVMFGARFSNLTNRGIITNGPYRWTKHPAYIAKNLSWWMISVPFIAHDSPSEALRHCLLLLGLNAMYALRAKTEERHLSADPDYVAYGAWIEERGIFRFVRSLSRIAGQLSAGR
jgi:protein-S-isoprenylcysteine O-methyltransferase Ste14